MADLLVWAAVDTDDTTVLLDLNAVHGRDDKGIVLKRLVLGGAPLSADFLEQAPAAGGEQVGAYYPPVKSKMIFSVLGDDYDDLDAQVEAFAAILQAGGTFRFQPKNATDAKLYDFFPSSTAGLFVDEALTYPTAAELFMAIDLEVEFWRHPFARKAPVTLLDEEAITNNTAQVLTVDNPGNAESEARLVITVPSDTARVTQVRVGKRRHNDEYVSDFTTGAISGASSLDAFSKRLWRTVLEPTDPMALAGTFRFLAEAAFDGADIYHLQLRYGLVDVEPAGASNDVYDFDTSDVTDFSQSSDLDLGLVTFDETGTALVLEIWGRSEAEEDITWGNWTLMPADEQLITLSSPGQRNGFFGLEEWGGLTLEASGDVVYDDDTYAVLNDTDEEVRVPGGGLTLPEGQHVFLFTGFVQNNPGTKEKAGELQVLQDDVVIARTTIRSAAGVTYENHGLLTNPIQARFVVTSADTGSLFDARVIWTADSTATKTAVGFIKHHFIPTVSDGASMVVDALLETAYIGEGEAKHYPLQADGGLLTLGKDMWDLVFRLYDAASKNYDSVDAREPLAEVVDARTADVTVIVTPRHTH